MRHVEASACIPRLGLTAHYFTRGQVRPPEAHQEHKETILGGGEVTDLTVSRCWRCYRLQH